jgi:hypothetical protein
VRYLRARGFTAEASDPPGNYLVTAFRDNPMPLRPRLSLPDDLLTKYLNEMDQTPGATAWLSSLSLTEVHLEEALSTSVDGQSHTTAVGARRGPQGGVEWFWDREPSPPAPDYGVPPGELEWRADRPQ